MGLTATLEIDGRTVQLPDPSGGTFNAAGDFDRLLQFATDLPTLSRIDEHGDVHFSSPELASLGEEMSSLLQHARLGPERHGALRLIALASHGSQQQSSVLHVAGD